MAAIPTVLYIGDDQICNGIGGLRAPASPTSITLPPPTGTVQLGGAYGLWQHNWKFSRVVPSGADGISGGTFDPYWDSQVGGGSWVKFHYAPQGSLAAVLATTGDNHQQPLDTLGTITPTPMLMNKLWERFPGGFKLIKFTNGQGFSGVAGFNAPSGGSFLGIVGTTDTAANALPVGDTLDIKAIVVDAAVTDIVNVGTSYLTFQADVTSFVQQIRAALDALTRVACASTTPIMLVVPHPDLSPVVVPDPLATTQFFRGILHGVANTEANVHAFDMTWARTWQTTGVIPIPGVSNAPGVYTPAGSRRYYGTDDYVEAGIRIGNALIAVWAEVPIADPGAAIPVVVMIGDSQFVGVISNLFIELTRQPSLLGPDPSSTERTSQWIWNAGAGAIQPYDVMTNSNTQGTVNSTTFGPDATLLKKLGQQFPGGVILWKYARNGVCLTTDAQGGANGVEEGGAIWSTLRSQWSLFKQACLTQLGRSPDLVGILSDLGGNDASNDGGSTAFAAKVGDFVDDLRLAFSTRAVGAPVPIVWLQPPPPVTDGGTSIHNLSPSATMTERVNRVRNAIAALATSKPRVAVLTNAGDGDYELIRPVAGQMPPTEPVHYGGEAELQLGYDFFDALMPLVSATASGDGAAAGGGVDEGVGVDGPVEGGEAAAAAGDAAMTFESAMDIISSLDQAIQDGGDIAAYSVNGRYTQLRSLNELIAARKYFVAEAAKARGLRRTRIRFTQ